MSIFPTHSDQQEHALNQFQFLSQRYQERPVQEIFLLTRGFLITYPYAPMVQVTAYQTSDYEPFVVTQQNVLT